MRILIYSDVHGNLPAFEQMLKKSPKCDGYISLGDLVNYGPWSNECVDLAHSLPNSILIMGNHEDAFIDGTYNGSNKLVQDFFSTTYPSFNRHHLIKKFLRDFKLNNFVCTHTVQNQTIYPDSKIELDGNYFIGHSHHQFRITDNGYTLYNPGSVGQNRKQINAINFLIFDMEKMSVKMMEIEHDIKQLLTEMRKRKYPLNCMEYYLSKLTIYK